MPRWAPEPPRSVHWCFYLTRMTPFFRLDPHICSQVYGTFCWQKQTVAAGACSFPREFILFESDFTHTQGGIYFVSCTFRYLHFSSKCNFYPSFFLFCRHVRCVRRRRRKQGQPSFVWPRAIHFCFIHRRQLDDLTFCKGGPCVDSSINWKFQNFFGIIYFNDVEVVACATSH